MEIFNLLFGYLSISLNGSSIERFLNLCSMQGILLWDLKKTAEGYQCSLSLESFYKIRPLLKKTGTKIRILQRRGAPFWLFRHKRRKIFGVGVVLAILFVSILSSHIWLIEIEGNSQYSDDTLLNYLQEINICSGTKIQNVDCEEIEAQLREEFEDIIWVSVSRTGTSLKVSCTESLLHKEPTESDATDAQMYDIVATKDAIIQSVVTRKGTPCVKAGDAVKKGDVLVSARIDIYNDAGEIAAYQYESADADIIGVTSYAYKESFSRKQVKKTFTGRQIKGICFIFPSKTLQLAAKWNDMEHFEILSEYVPLKLGTNLYLPLTIKQSVCHEYVNESFTYAEEEAKVLAENELDKFCEKLTQKGIQIIEKNVMIDISNLTCNAKGTIQTAENIAEQKACKIEQISIKEGLDTNESE